MNDQTPAVKPPIFGKELAKELANYKGLWVAIDGQRVVAVSNSADEVVEQAHQQGVGDPLLFRVPEHPERIRI